MAWNDDSWKDSYDAWKLASPDDDYCDEPGCDHENAAIDWEGRWQCDDCGESLRLATVEEIARQEVQESKHAAWLRKQERREFWRRLTYPFRWPIFRLFDRIWPRKACRVLYDEEIPF